MDKAKDMKIQLMYMQYCNAAGFATFWELHINLHILQSHYMERK